MIDITSRTASSAARNIKIIGIGGAGANVLDRLALDGVAPACLVAANTEAQALVASVAGEKIQLGLAATRGLGSGGDPDLGRCAAEEALAELRAALEGAEAVFIVAGLGGGTGSGATPLVAELAREAGATVIAVVTLPFRFEGKRRAAQASEALAALQAHADAVVCFENDRMGDAAPPRAGIQTAFVAADQTLSQSILALAALLNRSGLIHLGMDDLTAVLRDAGAHCLFGYGEAEGDNRSFDALARALKNPLMDKGRMLRDCETVMVQVSGGPDMTLDEVQLLMEEFNRFVSDRARLLFGAAVDPELAGRITVTIMSSIGDIQPVASHTPVFQAERVVPASAAPRRAPVQPAPKPPVIEPQEEEQFVPEARVVLEPEFSQEREAVEVELAGEMEPAEIEENFSLEVQEPGVETAAEVEEPVMEAPPVAPLVEKPRGLRTATQQASLFGEEPAAPVERVTPPVPGRMLRRPFPEKTVPPPISTPAPVPAVAAVTESEPELKPSAVRETKSVQDTEPVPEPIPQVKTTPVIPEPRAEPRPAIALRRTAAVQPPRSPELIPAHEIASTAPSKAPQQEIMEFEPVTRGRFEKSEPTIVDGQDLDVPTYLRRRVKLR